MTSRCERASRVFQEHGIHAISTRSVRGSSTPQEERAGAPTLFDNGVDRVDWLSQSTTTVGINAAGCKAFDPTPDQWRGRRWHDVWSPQSHSLLDRHIALARSRGSTRFTAFSDRDGEVGAWDVVLSATSDGLLAQARDNTAVCAEVNRHRHHARHDELTGLLNRIAFKDAIECEVDRHNATGRPGAVLMLDLDNFKLINDTMGHDVGDATLQAVADGIREVVGGDDHAARLGGDEFAVILRDVLALDQLRATVEKLLESLGRPVTIKGRTVVPRSSIGAALFLKHGQTAAALLKNADVALYAAKSVGRGGYVVFVPSMGRPIQRRAAAAAAMRAALAEDRLDVVYQPIVNLERGR